MKRIELDGGYVSSEIHGTLGVVEFFHPQSNSLPGRILNELAQAIHGMGNEPEVQVVLLRSGGNKAFCAGASFDELMAITNEREGLHFFSGFAHVINAMRKCPKLIVGRIHGRCVGGGVGIAAACDYAIASHNAEVKLSELAVGIGPFVVGPVIERKMGVSAFSQLAIDASMWRSSDWARRKGLFAELHDTEEGMDESIQRLLLTLQASNPEAMAEMKAIFWQGTQHWDQLLLERAAISGRLVLGQHTRQFIASFKQGLRK